MTQHSPRRTLSVFLVMVAVSTVFLNYWQYSRSFQAEPAIWSSTLNGQTAAPAQYRIGVLKAAEFITLHSPLAMRHALALIDIIAILIAMFVLRALLLRSTTWHSASIAAKWFGAITFVALLQYSLVWLGWYQRPETLPIAALLALSLWLSTYRLPIAGAAGTLLTALCLILLGILLGFTRADVAVTFNLGIALVCLRRFHKSGCPIHRGASSRDGWDCTETTLALPRWPQCIASLAAAAAAAATQLYIMRVLYPHATYGTTPIFQLLLNVTDHIRIVPFTLFMIPSVWAAVQIIRRGFCPKPAQTGLLIGAAIFTCLWCVLGKIDEVRIFLPFSFALAPLTVEIAMSRIAAFESASSPHNVS